MWPFKKSSSLAAQVRPKQEDLLYWGRLKALMDSAGPKHRAWLYRCPAHGDTQVWWGSGGPECLTIRCGWVPSRNSCLVDGCSRIRVLVGPANARDTATHEGTLCDEDCAACYPSAQPADRDRVVAE